MASSCCKLLHETAVDMLKKAASMIMTIMMTVCACMHMCVFVCVCVLAGVCVACAHAFVSVLYVNVLSTYVLHRSTCRFLRKHIILLFIYNL